MDAAWIVPLAVLKGALMAVVILGIAETSFLQAIVVAAVSATITGGSLLVATWMQTRHTGAKVAEVRERVEAVAEAVDAPDKPANGTAAAD